MTITKTSLLLIAVSVTLFASSLVVILSQEGESTKGQEIYLDKTDPSLLVGMFSKYEADSPRVADSATITIESSDIPRVKIFANTRF